MHLATQGPTVTMTGGRLSLNGVGSRENGRRGVQGASVDSSFEELSC